MREKTIYIGTILTTLMVGVIGTICVLKYLPDNNTNDDNAEKTIKNVSVTETNTIKSAIDKIYDAVVYIESYKNNRAISSGTGFIYKKENGSGYIITNNHVIDGADKVEITNTKGHIVEATILGKDLYADIAVLSIQDDVVLSVAEIGDSTKIELGDSLFTVGSPLGIDYMGTVTKGILSGKDRAVEVTISNSNYIMEVIQTDAAINPGNSGGPLCNINGEVIGVNSLKLVQQEIEGMGFAIPIEIVMATVDRLEKGDEVKRPLLGVEMLDINDTWQLQRNGIQISDKITSGVVVVNISDNTPAKTAELKKGDVLQEINGVKIKSLAHFRFLLYKYNVGDTITIKYSRDGKNSEVKIKLDKSM